MGRKLASIQKILDIKPIPGADKIEIATLLGLGWEVVIQKNENYKAGDLVIYCEVDSQLPEKPQFEFLRAKKFRIKTIKLKGQVSQGIVFPLSLLPNPFNHFEGEDVTDVLGITKYDPQVQEEKALGANNTQNKSKILKFFMAFKLFRFFYFKLRSKRLKGWPEWIAKTDEERIQSCMKILYQYQGKPFYVTEKLDGQSATYFTYKQKSLLGFVKWCFGVCSRNIRLTVPDNSNYWYIAKNLDLKNRLLKLKKDKLVIQGEICGPKIQDNKYKFADRQLYVFNIVDNGRKYNYDNMASLCNNLDYLTCVPLIDQEYTWYIENDDVQQVVHKLVEKSKGPSVFNKDMPREGLVFRLIENPNISFKVINPDFLIKYGQ